MSECYLVGQYGSKLFQPMRRCRQQGLIADERPMHLGRLAIGRRANAAKRQAVGYCKHSRAIQGWAGVVKCGDLVLRRRSWLGSGARDELRLGHLLPQAQEASREQHRGLRADDRNG